jgi:hypothetical protein
VAFDGTIYIGSYGNDFYALTTSGSVKWSITYLNPNSAFVSTPAVNNDGSVYTVATTSAYTLLSAFTVEGDFLWGKNYSRPFYANPVLDKTGVFLYVATGEYIFNFYTPTGSVVFSNRYGGGGTYFTSSLSTAIDGTLYAPSADSFLYAVAPTGTLKWTFRTSFALTSSSVVDGEGTVYIHGNDQNLYALYPSGSLKWQAITHNTDPSESLATQQSLFASSPALNNGVLYVGSTDGNLYAFTATTPAAAPVKNNSESSAIMGYIYYIAAAGGALLLLCIVATIFVCVVHRKYAIKGDNVKVSFE